MKIVSFKCNSVEDRKKVLAYILRMMSSEPKEFTPNINFFIERVAEKMNWDYEDTDKFMSFVNSVYPTAAFSIMLREIAIWLDAKYPDHISKSEKIYVISTCDGKIHELNKKSIKSWKNFAAFRTIEDAKTACRICSHIIKALFK